MGRLHRLLDYCSQTLCQGVQVNFIAQIGTEGFECADCIVLAEVEAAINRVLHAFTLWMEERINMQSGANNNTRGDHNLSRLPVNKRVSNNSRDAGDYI